MSRGLRKVRLTAAERFGFWGNDVTRIQYDPTGGDDQTVEFYAGSEYIGGQTPADRPELKAIIDSHRSGVRPDDGGEE